MWDFSKTLSIDKGLKVWNKGGIILGMNQLEALETMTACGIKCDSSQVEWAWGTKTFPMLSNVDVTILAVAPYWRDCAQVDMASFIASRYGRKIAHPDVLQPEMFSALDEAIRAQIIKGDDDSVSIALADKEAANAAADRFWQKAAGLFHNPTSYVEDVFKKKASYLVCHPVETVMGVFGDYYKRMYLRKDVNRPKLSTHQASTGSRSPKGTGVIIPMINTW